MTITKAPTEFDAFISYAREDSATAELLARELRRAGFSIWLDREQLLPGQIWRTEIENAIPQCLTFVALASERSVTKVGFVQRELKIALEVIDTIPQNIPFVIPVRLDHCKPSHSRLRDIQWLDLFEDWSNGVAKLATSIRLARRLRGRPDSDESAKALITIKLDSIDAALPVIQALRTRPEIAKVWIAEGEDDLIVMVDSASDTLLDTAAWIRALRGVAKGRLQLILETDP